MSTSGEKNVNDFQKITGLTEQIAKQCFSAFGNYAVALASFAQSYPNLPKSYFLNPNAANKNAKEINSELLAIYRRARELKAKSGQLDKEVWKNYGKEATPQPQKSEPPKPPAVGGSSATSIFPGFPPAKAPGKMDSFSFGFGQSAGGAPRTASNAPIAPFPSAFSGFGKPAQAAASSAVKSAAPEKKPPEETSATHFTGPYFELPQFWEEEVLKRAPLFNCDKGFIEQNKDKLRPRMEKWLKRSSFYRKPLTYFKVDNVDEEVVRVIIKDADRTFFHPEHRAKLVAFLHALSHEFKAYGQAMSYLSALCMLALTEEETASIIRFVSTEYIKGHWAAEAVGFATSAWVVEYFMQKRFPDVAKHLDSLNLWPDTYLQKILTGLCIHVLPFNDLFDFLDAFMLGGLRYLVRFCLAIVEHYRDKILSIKSTTEANTLYEIMRLDRNVADRNDVQAILKRAPFIDLGEDEENIDVIRSQVYEKKVEPRLVRAPKTNTYEPCSMCEERPPEWWNDDIGAVCSPCKEANPGTKFENF
ncbi:unnamed protein product [Phytomonas sp. EM1]|nr:unnamed protein product [Phytomonas sp. EM1]|eukprot:CCW63305.1 unnamed protein product [Phytomonas sp. isolate EM1]